MDAYIVTDSSSYEQRALLAGTYLIQNGARVTYVFSDFSHADKRKKAVVPEQGTIYINAGGYKKNISPGRLLYHHVFASKAYGFLKERHIDLLYVLLPGNSLAPAAAQLKKEKQCGLVFDLIDLWPESLPFKKPGSLPPLSCWRDLREKYINHADSIITECALYLGKSDLDKHKAHVMYWTGNDEGLPGTVPQPEPDENENSLLNSAPRAVSDGGGILNIAYLGSINNIIDIPSVAGLLKALSALTPVRLHIIGGGERKDFFLRLLRENDIDYCYYGFIYDGQEKARILRRCSFGLNIMKSSVTVGLTMKSIDYMANGLMLINNISGDTWDIVEKNSLGVNLSGDFARDALKIVSFNGAGTRGIYNFYSNNFTRKAAFRVLDRALGFASPETAAPG